MFSNNKSGGINILGIILLAIILILIFNYFHLSLRVSVNNTEPESSVSSGGVFTNIWNTYFKKPVDFIWNEFIVKTFWQPFMNTMTRIGNSEWTTQQDDEQLLPPSATSQ